MSLRSEIGMQNRKKKPGKMKCMRDFLQQDDDMVKEATVFDHYLSTRSLRNTRSKEHAKEKMQNNAYL